MHRELIIDFQHNEGTAENSAERGSHRGEAHVRIRAPNRLRARLDTDRSGPAPLQVHVYFAMTSSWRWCCQTGRLLRLHLHRVERTPAVRGAAAERQEGAGWGVRARRAGRPGRGADADGALHHGHCHSVSAGPP